MTKNDKRLCWNCEGNVSHHISQCPYCGVDLTQPTPHNESQLFKGFASPFQSSQRQDIPQPPYAKVMSQDHSVSEKEWKAPLHEKKEEVEEESDERTTFSTKREMVALLLLLPGVVFFLFGLALILFSNEGILTLQWNQNVAYFYFMGCAPLLYLGWRAFR